MPNLISSVQSVDYHRNGVAGEGFHVITFTMRDGRERRPMVATVFATPGQIAVLDVGKLADGDVAFGSNSWRGDDFEPELRQAIAEYEVARDASLTAWLDAEATRVKDEAKAEKLRARRSRVFATIRRAERACYTRNHGRTAERRRTEARERLARATTAYAALDQKINAVLGASHV